MHRIGPANEVARSGGDDTMMFIRWQPKKKGSVEVQVPMSWDLSLELAGLAADAPSYLLTDHGKPFSSSGSLDNRVRKWIVEAGGTVYEVMAHLSHSDPKTSAIYTQRVERARLAEQAVRRMEKASKTQGVPRL